MITQDQINNVVDIIIRMLILIRLFYSDHMHMESLTKTVIWTY
jgi:hypothetical protein